jgi:hypothetical protein
MVEHESETDEAAPPRLRQRPFLAQNWLYILMLILAMFGVAVTNVARQAMTAYWIALAPVFAAICIYARWRAIDNEEELNWKLVGEEMLHWTAVMVAMYLVFVADVKQMMNADASALMILTILALGTFTAGIHIGVWRISFVGVVLALGVPLIAWIDQVTLLLVLLAAVLITFLGLLFYRGSGAHKAGERASLG